MDVVRGFALSEIVHGPVTSILLTQVGCYGTVPWSVSVTVITLDFCLVIPWGAALLWLLPDINSLQKEDYLKHSFSKTIQILKCHEIHCGIKRLLKNLRQVNETFFTLSLKENSKNCTLFGCFSPFSKHVLSPSKIWGI